MVYIKLQISRAQSLSDMPNEVKLSMTGFSCCLREYILSLYEKYIEKYNKWQTNNPSSKTADDVRRR